MNGIGTVLIRGQWGKDLTQPSWILYCVLPNSIFLPLDLTVNLLFFYLRWTIKSLLLLHVYKLFATESV